MHDIWNPWHGCIKCSPGCEHCYMYFLDRKRADRDGSEIKRNGDVLFRYPVSKNRQGEYKIKPGERIRVCMTSDFFLAQVDEWREDAWDIIRQRPDVKFWLLTKRPERVVQCLPSDWGDGWDNVMLNVTAENQAMAAVRLPILQAIPAKHKGVCVAPWIGPVSLKPWLGAGFIDEVCAGGENYDGARPCHFEWVQSLRQECVDADTTFCWYETGTVFIKDGVRYHIPYKSEQSRQAYLSGMNHKGREVDWVLRDPFDGHVLSAQELHAREFCPHCVQCANRLICNGCSRCGNCGVGHVEVHPDEI